MSSAAKAVIALLVAPESTPSVLYGLYDVLVSVGTVYPDMTTGESGESLLDVRIVSATGQPFRCFGNVLVEQHASLADLPRVDAAAAPSTMWRSKRGTRTRRSFAGCSVGRLACRPQRIDASSIHRSTIRAEAHHDGSHHADTEAGCDAEP